MKKTLNINVVREKFIEKRPKVKTALIGKQATHQLRVWSISLILFEVEITNLEGKCIFGSWSVAYHFGVTVTFTLTSGLRSKKIVSRA